MSDFIPMPSDFEDIKEPVPTPNGLYALRIADAELKKEEDGSNKVSKNGELMFNIRIEFIDYPDNPNIFHNLIMPNEDSKPFTKVMTKKFLEVFNIDPYTIDEEGQCFHGMNNPSVKVKFVAAKGEYRARNELDL